MKVSVLTISILILAMAHTALAHPQVSENDYEFEKEGVSLQVSVHLAESYESDKNATYPVIYLLDGYWTLEPMLRFYDNLRFDNMVPEMIVVSIDYPKSIKDVEQKRMWDLTHQYDTGFKAGGDASTLLDILANELVPAVEENYRVDNDRTILIGHSLAGLFALYTMYQKPDTFSHYAAISPSALWADAALAKLDKDYAEKHSELQANTYITYGTAEYAPYVQSLEAYIRQLQQRKYDGLNLTLASVEKLRHVSMKTEGFVRALVWSVADIRPQGPSEFEKMNLRALGEL